MGKASTRLDHQLASFPWLILSADRKFLGCEICMSLASAKASSRLGRFKQDAAGMRTDRLVKHAKTDSHVKAGLQYAKPLDVPVESVLAEERQQEK
eukprot:Awhi_evm1s5677